VGIGSNPGPAHAAASTGPGALIPLRLRVGIFAAIVFRMNQFCIADFVRHLANVLLVGPLLRGPRAN
jgi:hypothetical protein